MAKLLFGIGIADARNKLGGHVFSKNRFGAYVRQKVSPSQPRSPAQLVVRSAFGGFSKAWSSALTDSQRAAWISLTAGNPRPDAFGNPQVLTGLQMFQSVNRNLHTIGVAELDDAPGNLSVEGLTALALTANVTGSIFSVTFTPQTLDPHMHIVVTATPPMSAGKSFFTPFLKLIFADTHDASGSPEDLFTVYHNLFGNLAEGSRIGINAYVINDSNGASSTPAAASAIVGV